MRYLIVLLALLAGCETMQQKQEREKAEYEARRHAYWSGVRDQCIGYGFVEKTPEFRDCIAKVDMTNRQNAEAQRQMILQQYIQGHGIFSR